MQTHQRTKWLYVIIGSFVSIVVYHLGKFAFAVIFYYLRPYAVEPPFTLLNDVIYLVSFLLPYLAGTVTVALLYERRSSSAIISSDAVKQQ